MKTASIILVALLCLLLSGCYTHIAGADTWVLIFVDIPLPVSSWKEEPHNLMIVPVYAGRMYGGHLMIFYGTGGEWSEDSFNSVDVGADYWVY